VLACSLLNWFLALDLFAGRISQLQWFFFVPEMCSFLNLTESSPMEENICESFKDLKEFHGFFMICLNL
jgi:hypothetical protein